VPTAPELSPEQIRVLGALLEKQRTTPDAYPLSLNALRLACNQSTNRDPVVEYDEAVIRDALHRLERRGMVRLASGAGSRASKYRHLLAETLPMDDAEQAVMCVLMLRGPQTPGELKQRGERNHAFADLAEVGGTLDRLAGRGLVARLQRRPGQKEERYTHLLSAEENDGSAGTSAQTPPPVAASPPVAESVDGTPVADSLAAAPTANGGGAHPLEQRVARLEREVAQLRARLDEVDGGARSGGAGPGALSEDWVR
jgi:uncharacterized protein YceH (UPF0502 family)